MITPVSLDPPSQLALVTTLARLSVICSLPRLYRLARPIAVSNRHVLAVVPLARLSTVTHARPRTAPLLLRARLSTAPLAHLLVTRARIHTTLRPLLTPRHRRTMIYLYIALVYVRRSYAEISSEKYLTLSP